MEPNSSSSEDKKSYSAFVKMNEISPDNLKQAAELANKELIIRAPEFKIDTEENFGLHYNNRLISSFICLPVSSNKMVGYDENEHFLDIIVYLTKELFVKVSLTPREFEMKNWVLEKLGFVIGTYISDADYEVIKKAILHLARYLAPRIGYIYMGHSKTDDIRYICGSKCILRDGSIVKNEVSSDKSILKYNLNIDKTISEKDSCSFVFKYILKIASLKQMIPLISCALLSLCFSLLKAEGYPPDFLLMALGRTGSGKTSIFKVLFNIYNPSKINVSFDSTLAAIDEELRLNRDTTVIVDNLRPPSSLGEKSKFREKLNLLLHSVGDNGSERQKMHGRKVDTYSMECLPVITAEDIPTEVASSIARLFVVELSRNTINFEMLTQVQNNLITWSTFIYYYILHIMKTDDFIHTMVKRFHQFRDEYIQLGLEAHSRMYSNSAWIKASFLSFLEYAKQLDVIDGDTFKSYVESTNKYLKDYIIQSKSLTDNASEVDMFITAIYNMQLTKEINISKLKNIDKENRAEQTLNTVGYEDDTYLYYMVGVAYAKVVQYYSKFGTNFSMSEKATRRALKDSGLLCPNNCSDGNLTTRITVNGNRVAVIRLKKKNVKEYLGKDEEYEKK